MSSRFITDADIIEEPETKKETRQRQRAVTKEKKKIGHISRDIESREARCKTAKNKPIQNKKSLLILRSWIADPSKKRTGEKKETRLLFLLVNRRKRQPCAPNFSFGEESRKCVNRVNKQIL